MKNKILIALIFPVLFWSCTPSSDAEEPVVLDFDLKCEVTGQRSIDVQLIPSSDEITYYYNILPSTEYVDDATLKLEDMLRFEEMAKESGKELSDVISSQIYSGTVSRSYEDLYPGVTYVLYAYQIDESGIATNAVSKKEITTKGYENIQIGDFYLMDGTIVSKDGNITDDIRSQIAGVIFWLGDPTAEGHDATLRKEHPNCTNGLVMALDTIMGVWSNSSKMINRWVKEDGRYMEIVFGDQEGADQPYNFIRGYNNTKAIEAYNVDASPVDFVQPITRLEHYRDSIPLPPSCSDWYLPSTKELSLMITGEYNGDIWDINAIDGPSPENKDIVNSSLEMVGADTISDWTTWASSTEHSPVMMMSIFFNGVPSGANKPDPYNIYRPVFAF